MCRFFIIMGTITTPFLIFTISLAFLRLINSANTPDMEGDKLGGKITLIVARWRGFGF